MIDFETAKKNAANVYEGRVLPNFYSELTDSWVFTFQEIDGKTSFVESVRVNKSDGTAEVWSFIKNRKEYFDKLIKANIPA